MIVSTAPGRCGILGNPTDMYGGSVISCSTRERARCEITENNVLVIEAEGAEPQEIRTDADLQPRGDLLDLTRAVLRGLEIRPSTHAFYLRTSTEIPMQSGLAGSTALVSAVVGAVAVQIQLRLHRHAMAETIRNLEYEVMEIVCGFQDHYMCVFGGLNYLDFRDKGSHLPPSVQPYATVEPLADAAPERLPFLLAHTGVRHNSGVVHKSIRERWLEGEAVVRAGYERVQHLARHNKNAVIVGDWECLAAAMNENQTIQRDLGGSGDACDHLIAVARDNGALGAKLAGAGHGGTIIALTLEPERTAEALRAAGASRILIPKPSDGLTIEFRS